MLVRHTLSPDGVRSVAARPMKLELFGGLIKQLDAIVSESKLDAMVNEALTEHSRSEHREGRRGRRRACGRLEGLAEWLAGWLANNPDPHPYHVPRSSLLSRATSLAGSVQYLPSSRRSRNSSKEESWAAAKSTSTMAVDGCPPSASPSKQADSSPQSQPRKRSNDTPSRRASQTARARRSLQLVVAQTTRRQNAVANMTARMSTGNARTPTADQRPGTIRSCSRSPAVLKTGLTTKNLGLGTAGASGSRSEGVHGSPPSRSCLNLGGRRSRDSSRVHPQQDPQACASDSRAAELIREAQPSPVVLSEAPSEMRASHWASRGAQLHSGTPPAAAAGTPVRVRAR